MEVGTFALALSSTAVVVGLLNAMVRMATPLLLSALGEMLSERSGILNVCLEGMMLVGSLAGFLAANRSGSPWIGVAVGGAAGALTALLHAFLSVSLGVSQVVSGIGINLLCLGLTTATYRAVFGMSMSGVPTAPAMQPVRLPGLAELPILGPVLFDQLPLVYLSLALVPALWFLMARTEWGLTIRAVGEHPLAAESQGVSVRTVRYLCVLTCGVLSGMAGSFLSLGVLSIFLDNMTSGRGWIALAVVIFGRWKPFGILAASMIFGLADALQLRLQIAGVAIPYQFLLMLPYVMTIISLVGAQGRMAAPRALGRPYLRDG
jgi:ABC-type uncharacterized transport system permease subunit